MYFAGGEHIDTRAVRQYLNNLEITLKAGKHDIRTSERPYSSLSWRLNDITNLEKKSHRPRSGKSSGCGQSSRPSSQISRTGSHYSRPPSHLSSRPVSGLVDHSGYVLGQPSNLAYLKASERLLLETNKPRLLQRESVERKLKSKSSPVSPPAVLSRSATDLLTTEDVRKQINIDIKTGIDEDLHGVRGDGLLDSYATETERSAVKFAKSPKISPVQRSPGEESLVQEKPMVLRSQFDEGQGQELRFVVQDSQGRAETPVEKLYKRFGSPKAGQSTSMSVGWRETKRKRPMGSARSAGSSYTMVSYSGMSMDSHRSNCDIPAGPHSVHISNARTTTTGPHSSIKSLMGDPGRRDISKGIHHKSAWYHVPGRYSTINKKVPPKRSQVREEASKLKKSMPAAGPDPYKAFMNSDYRKNNPYNPQKPSPYRYNGHTCGRDPGHPMYPNYHKHDSKQYTICESCQKEAEEALQHGEVVRVVQDHQTQDVNLRPTVKHLIRPDRAKQTSFIVEESMSQEEIEYSYPHTGTTVTFKESVEVN